ncbi:MAG TPA: IS66 family transposase [Sporichthyaceae bacterium]
MAEVPTYEQLVVLVAEQAATIARLEERVAELERQLGRNSRNSSIPPSKDPLEAPSRSLRRKAGRKPGKQPGAPGSALRLVDLPEEVVEHRPSACRGCGAALRRAAEVGVTRRQVHDIPQVSGPVTEHRLHRRRCACGCITTADAPAGVNAPVTYGSNLRALAVYLVVFQHVPVERAALLIADVTGAAVSTGWVSSTVAATAQDLVDVEAMIRTLITLAHVLHADETSTSIGGDTWWLHVASTPNLTAYHLDPSRGRKAVTAFGILPDYSGIAVHDALSVYDDYPKATHALCGAHIARELTAAAESHPDQTWPSAALDALFGLNDAAHAAREMGLHQVGPEIADPLHKAWQRAVLVGLAAHPRGPGRKQSKTRNLLDRLRDRDEQVLRFARDLSVPFTNNQAERDLRPAKTQLKISGCHRSETGARAWLRIRGYISTAHKNNINVLHTIRGAIIGDPWKPVPAT